MTMFFPWTIILRPVEGYKPVNSEKAALAVLLAAVKWLLEIQTLAGHFLQKRHRGRVARRRVKNVIGAGAFQNEKQYVPGLAVGGQGRFAVAEPAVGAAD